MSPFHEFLRRYYSQITPLGDAATACLDMLLIEKRTASAVVEELRLEAEDAGAYQGLKELWRLWQAEHPEAGERGRRAARQA